VDNIEKDECLMGSDSDNVYICKVGSRKFLLFYA